MPKRHYANHLVVSPELPAIKIQISDELDYLGTKIFPLSEFVEVENFVFVDTENNKVTRRLVVHFERLVKEPDFEYRMRVPTPLTHEINDQIFYTDIRCVPAHFFHDYQESQEDWAHVYRMIRDKGLEPPLYKSNILIKRLGQIVAEDGSAEFLMIYTEPFADGILKSTPDNTYLVTDRQRHLIADFEQRALDSFTLLQD